jgi:hypothetical protein
LGVTNTMAASSSGRCRSHAMHDTPTYWHHRAMSWRNDINGTTTMVVPPGTAHAGNMNNMLLPPPVGMIATTGLRPCWMAAMAGPWTPRNYMRAWPVICCIAVVMSMACSCCHRSY